MLRIGGFKRKMLLYMLPAMIGCGDGNASESVMPIGLNVKDVPQEPGPRASESVKQTYVAQLEPQKRDRNSPLAQLVLVPGQTTPTIRVLASEEMAGGIKVKEGSEKGAYGHEEKGIGTVHFYVDGNRMQSGFNTEDSLDLGWLEAELVNLSPGRHTLGYLVVDGGKNVGGSTRLTDVMVYGLPNGVQTTRLASEVDADRDAPRFEGLETITVDDRGLVSWNQAKVYDQSNGAGIKSVTVDAEGLKCLGPNSWEDFQSQAITGYETEINLDDLFGSEVVLTPARQGGSRHVQLHFEVEDVNGHDRSGRSSTLKAPRK